MKTIEDFECLINTASPRNVLWLRTIYEDIIQHPNLITEAPLKGIEVKCPVLNAEFRLEAKKTSDSNMSVICNRKFLSSHRKIDDGYFLRLYFTINGVEQETLSTVMRSDEKSVTVNFSISEDLPTEKYYVSTIKCVVRMIETAKLSGEYLDELEKEFQSFAKGFSKSQLKYMSYLLKSPKLKGIFTGRESADIILTKLSYIERSLPFAKQLAKYIKAKEQSDPHLIEVPLGEILCEISCGEKRTIKDGECITLYLNSIRIGLHYLYVIVSDYIINNFSIDYVVHVLKAADAANDRKLFKAASDFFLANSSEILRCDKWKVLAHSFPNCYARSIIHNIKLGQDLEGTNLPPGLFEETDEC